MKFSFKDLSKETHLDHIGSFETTHGNCDYSEDCTADLEFVVKKKGRVWALYLGNSDGDWLLIGSCRAMIENNEIVFRSFYETELLKAVDPQREIREFFEGKCLLSLKK